MMAIAYRPTCYKGRKIFHATYAYIMEYSNYCCAIIVNNNNDNNIVLLVADDFSENA